MLDNIKIVKPADIEKESMAIIESEMGEHGFKEQELKIVKRCIHTSADFDYKNNLVFSEDVIKKAISAIKGGATIITDTNMVLAGINKKVLAEYGASVRCFMADEDVAVEAKSRGVTRASISMERASKIEGTVILAVGNAPTALIRIHELHRDLAWNPAIVVAAPVGFVNVVESKRLILKDDMPYIVADGRKGGSNIAACIINAILYMI